MKQHTKEPWVVANEYDNRVHVCAPWSNEVRPEDSETFGSYLGAHVCELPFNDGVPTREQARANARRIVACVNVCAGIGTEILENAPDFSTAFLSSETIRLKEQRDELFAALKDLTGTVGLAIKGSIQWTAHKNARAVIAKTETA